MEVKDWLQVIVIPVSLALITLVWPLIQNWNRRRAFMSLIRRELREIGPYPSQPEKTGWADHLTKSFVHQRILREVSSNRDFVLSLEPEIVYFLSQLWDAHATRDQGQWLYYLKRLAGLTAIDTTGKLSEIYQCWKTLCNQYQERSGKVQDDG